MAASRKRVRCRPPARRSSRARLPSSVDRLVIQRPRRVQRRLGASATAAWVVGPLGECAARAQPLLGAGQVDELVDRGARIAQCGRGDRMREEPEQRKPIQRPVDASVRRTARTPARRGRTPRRPPRRGCRCRAGPGCARCRGSRGLSRSGAPRPGGTRSVLDEAAGEQHVGVGDPAAERPPARHRRPRRPRGGPCPAAPTRRPRRPVRRRTAPRGSRRQVGDQQAAGDRDRHTPAGRGVAAGHLLGAPQARRPARSSSPSTSTGAPPRSRPESRSAVNELVGQPAFPFDLDRQLTRQIRRSRRATLVPSRRAVGDVGVCSYDLAFADDVMVQSRYHYWFSF